MYLVINRVKTFLSFVSVLIGLSIANDSKVNLKINEVVDITGRVIHLPQKVRSFAVGEGRFLVPLAILGELESRRLVGTMNYG